MKQLTSRAFVLRNCFAEDPHTQVKPAAKVSPTYLSEEKTVDFFEGESCRMVQKEYPITKEYVKSFVEATDYKSGVEQKMPARQNLGDIRDAQAIAQRDTVDVKDMIADLQAKLDKVKEEVNKPATSGEKPVEASPAVADAGGDNNG